MVAAAPVVVVPAWKPEAAGNPTPAGSDSALFGFRALPLAGRIGHDESESRVAALAAKWKNLERSIC
jgi:hypothetical protein